MPIEHIISMFEQKIAKNIEELVLLNCNLTIFSFKFEYKAVYLCSKTRLFNEYGWFIRVFFYILIIYLGPNNKKVLQKQNIW